LNYIEVENFDISTYNIHNISELHSPSLIVYPNIVAHNIALAIAMVGGAASRLRPHIKTHKSSKVIALCQQQGISKYKAATIAEAELLAQCNATDVLLAYQPVGNTLLRYFALLELYPNTRFSCLVDNPHTVLEVNNIAKKEGKVAHVFIDLNTGQNRTGIAQHASLELATYIFSQKNISLVGLHHYDGHLHQASLEQRHSQAALCWQKTEQIIQKLGQLGHQTLEATAGGSPTFSYHCLNPQVTCSPGTFVYWDYGYGSKYTEQKFKPAAMLLTRIVSKPTQQYLCLDLGHKAIAAENPLDQRVYFPALPHATVVGQSEEHLVLNVGDSSSYQLGAELLAMPYHICPTVALHQQAYNIYNQSYNQNIWATDARNRTLNI
jgi:D-serine deaminase-like pyridoxal phosphate-dependent protein